MEVLETADEAEAEDLDIKDGVPAKDPKWEPRDAGGPVLQSRILVKVGIRVEAESVSIFCESALSVTDVVSGKKETWPSGRYRLTSRGGKVLVNDRTKGKVLKLRPVSSSAYLQSNTNSYRGDFIARAAEGSKVTLVNELSVDDYLKGVLPREVVVTWHMESLKVQAVASRTYMASHLGRHASQGFDLCSDVHCQVYGGMTREHAQCNSAVNATRGQILTYEGKPIGAYFHSNCGGITEQVHLVWGLNDRPFLPRKKCSFGTADPKYNWTLTYTNEEIIKLLKAKTSVKGDRLEAVRIAQKSPSGRAQKITVETDEGTFNLSGNEFRIALHPEKIRSTLWLNFSSTGDGYRFEGRGWGHGVGMCQWGAKGQAEHGRSYKTILQFYYPNTKLQAWSHR